MVFVRKILAQKGKIAIAYTNEVEYVFHVYKLV